MIVRRELVTTKSEKKILRRLETEDTLLSAPVPDMFTMPDYTELVFSFLKKHSTSPFSPNVLQHGDPEIAVKLVGGQYFDENLSFYGDTQLGY